MKNKFLILFHFLSIYVFGNVQLDSLKTLLDKETVDSNKVSLFIKWVMNVFQIITNSLCLMHNKRMAYNCNDNYRIVTCAFLTVHP